MLYVSTDLTDEPTTAFSILKRGKHFSEFQPASLELAPQNRMKDVEKQDVMALLHVIGVEEGHPAYPFYKESCGTRAPPEQKHSTSEDSDSEASD